MSEIKKQTKFDPKDHLVKLSKKEKQPDGSYRMVEKGYLPVAWRVVWFREDHPDWSIVTNIEKLAEGAVIFKAQIYNGSGLVATAHKTGRKADFADYIEKAEAGAIGRALAYCGYGTQFAPETEEGERIADAPVAASAPVSTSIPFDQPAPAENVVDNPAIKTAAQVEPKLATTASPAQRKMLFALGKQLGFDGSEVQHLVKEEFKLDSFTTLTTVQAHKMIETWRLSLGEVPQQAEPPLEQNVNQF